MPDLARDETLFVRLYLDRHVMTRLADDLTGRGYDCLTTQQAGNDTASDEEQLAFAADNRGQLSHSIFETLLHFASSGFAPIVLMQASSSLGSSAADNTAF